MTRLFASLRIALRALMVNKMRSALTMLGIIIGVGAVIAMIAVGSGAKKRIAEQIASMGSNLLIVMSGSSTSGGIRFGSGTVPTLTADDGKAILAEIPGVKYVAANLNGVAQVVFGNQNWSTIVNGTAPEMFLIRDWTLSSGRSFTQQDVDGAAKVCLLGKTVAENLFWGGRSRGSNHSYQERALYRAWSTCPQGPIDVGARPGRRHLCSFDDSTKKALWDAVSRDGETDCGPSKGTGADEGRGKPD